MDLPIRSSDVDNLPQGRSLQKLHFVLESPRELWEKKHTIAWLRLAEPE